MAKLARFVFARDESGVMRSWGPSDDVPASVAKTITMPGVWANGDDAAPAAPKKRRKPVERPAEGSVQESPASSPAPQGTNDDAGTTGAE